MQIEVSQMASAVARHHEAAPNEEKDSSGTTEAPLPSQILVEQEMKLEVGR